MQIAFLSAITETLHIVGLTNKGALRTSRKVLARKIEATK
jgi:hypothetical protein